MIKFSSTSPLSLPNGYIWVKVIRANPLIGPCVGQVQFLVDWTIRKFTMSANMDSMTISYKGKKKKVYSVGNFGIPSYVTVHENFTLHMPSSLVIDWYITMEDGRKLDISSFLPSPPDSPLVKNPSRVSYDSASEEIPPQLRNFQIYFGDSNNRHYQESVIHWDACLLCNSLIHKYFKPYWARQVDKDGDSNTAYASVYSGDECFTLYVE